MKNTLSIRKQSWFEKSNMTIEKILKYTYRWAAGLSQEQIRKELKLGRATGVDWDMFCREVCEVLLFDRSEQIGGKDVRVQIDESKFGKPKYYKGHRVEGQWLFRRMKENSRKCFMVKGEKRDRDTLIPLITKWIKPGSVINF